MSLSRASSAKLSASRSWPTNTRHGRDIAWNASTISAVAAADGIGGDDVRVGGERLSRQRAGRPVDAEPFAHLDNAEVGISHSQRAAKTDLPLLLAAEASCC